MYMELFDSWKAVQGSFRMTDPEPEKVFWAYYSYEDYSGSALVVYFNQGKYYYATGSHCSCHGLEDQWEPEEYDYDGIIAVLSRGGYQPGKSIANAIKQFAGQYEPTKPIIEI